MPPLRISADEFRAIADGVNRLVADFLSDLEERRTVSATSTTDTAAFDLPLPEEGVGEAALRDLEAISEHLRRPRGAVSRTCLGRETRSGRWATSTRLY